ncbi:E1 ubiquitin-activating protein uba2 [Cryptotrichosporon argae]
MPRHTYTQSLLGPDLFEKVKTTRVLVVGAGGIGCELLKNLVLVGFAQIEIIDLDTIDLSNLNRQFLFRKPDISKPKALVAAATARHFNPSSGIDIHARHGNVKDVENDLEWIKGFGLVMSALDNADARSHLNRLCQAGDVPLIESGTSGYAGQVRPIIHDKTECYDCTVRNAPKSFPVCTIRATPSEPIHCIVWGKSYLLPKLFGEDDEAVDEDELEKAKQSGENADEIENLKKEAAAFREVRRLLGEENGAVQVFEKVFDEDIKRLLAMEDMWKVVGRVKPTPLNYRSIMDGTFVTPPKRPSKAAAPAAKQPNGTPAASGATLKDQRKLTVKDNLELFIDSCQRLSARVIARPGTVVSFDKDDDDTLDFVLAVANLRAIAYGIPERTRFQVKEMAGNIIPAIATTNAIIAGFVVLQALAVLRDLSSLASSSSDSFAAAARKANITTPFLTEAVDKPLQSSGLGPPNPACPVCRDVYIPLKADVSALTLGTFVEDVVEGWLGGTLEGEPEFSIQEGDRLLADPDFDDNYERTLKDMGIERGKMLTVIDEDNVYRPIHFCLCTPDANATAPYVLPEQPPAIPRRPVPQATEAESDDSDDDFELSTGAAAAPAVAVPIASRKRRAGENGADGDVGLGQDGKRRKVEVTGEVIEVE